MDKKVANHLIVGVIVTLGFLAFLFVLFNVGGGAGFLSSRYLLMSRFKDVKGLHGGSEISLSGLRVGVVKSIRVATDESKELVVELLVNNAAQERILKDSRAIIRTQGLLGDKYVEITIGSNAEPALNAGETIQTEEPQDLFTKSSSLVEGISRKFQDSGDFTELIRNINTLVKNLNSVVVDIKQNKGTLNGLIYGQGGPRLDATLSNLESITKKIQQGDGTLGALINDPTIYEDLKSLLGGAKRSNVLKYFLRGFVEEGKEIKEKEPAKEKK